MTIFITILSGVSLICGAGVLLSGLGAFGFVFPGQAQSMILMGLALMIVGFVGVWLARRASS